MNILLTGCAGFIGAKVADGLLNEGHHVLGIDNLNDAYDVRLKEWRLGHLSKIPGFNYYSLDITNAIALQQFLNLPDVRRFIPFDAVINLAARAGVRQSIETPDLFYETNVMGTLNLLEICRKQEVKKFVLASTSSVYGSQIETSRIDLLADAPFTDVKTHKQLNEALSTDQPISPYAASKKAAEGLCYTYHHLYGLDVTVFRFFTVYGPAGRPDMSIFRFIRWIYEGNPVAVYGDGLQSRDFTYVGDITRGVIAGLKPLGFETINLGSDHPVTLNEVIWILERIIDREASIDYQPPNPADINATWADVSKAQRILNWSSEVSLEEGLRRSVGWYKENRDLASVVNL